MAFHTHGDYITPGTYGIMDTLTGDAERVAEKLFQDAKRRLHPYSEDDSITADQWNALVNVTVMRLCEKINDTMMKKEKNLFTALVEEVKKETPPKK